MHAAEVRRIISQIFAAATPHSFISAITLLGTPSEVYVFGTQYVIFCFCFPIVSFVVTRWFIPVYYHLGVSTSYEVRCGAVAI